MRIFVATLLFMNVLYLNFAFAEGDFVYDTVKIGGINQVVAYKGAKDGPLILFLHGGPGSSRMPQAEIFTTELQKKMFGGAMGSARNRQNPSTEQNYKCHKPRHDGGRHPRTHRIPFKKI